MSQEQAVLPDQAFVEVLALARDSPRDSDATRTAREQLLVPHLRLLLFLADRWLPPDGRAIHDTEDFVQQTACKALRKLAPFHGDSRQCWRAWLVIILDHAIRDFLGSWEQRRRALGLICAGGGRGSGGLLSGHRPLAGRRTESARNAASRRRGPGRPVRHASGRTGVVLPSGSVLLGGGAASGPDRGSGAAAVSAGLASGPAAVSPERPDDRVTFPWVRAAHPRERRADQRFP